jgi:hypothetical protein
MTPTPIVRPIKTDAEFIDVREFVCPSCIHAGLYTEDGFMGHYAITCKLIIDQFSQEQIVEPDSPNEDGTLDFVVECDTFSPREYRFIS